MLTGDVLSVSNGMLYSSVVLCGTIRAATAASTACEIVGYGATLTANSTDVSALATNVGEQAFVRIFRYAGTANDTRAWSAGGSMTHETSTVPGGMTYSHKFTHTSASYWTRMEWGLARPHPGAISIPVYAKHDSTGLSGAQLLRWELIDPASDPIFGGTALATWTASDSTDWQTSTLTYTKTDDRPLVLRVSAKRGSGISYAYVDTQAAGGGLLTHPSMTGGLRG